MPKLVLFDIDGILIRSKVQGISTSLIEKHFGIVPFQSKLYLEGKTWKWILTERLKEAGIENPEEDARFNIALNDVSPIIDGIKNGNIRIEKILFVEDLIKKLLEKGHIIGLLTGNSKESSKVKLENVDLWKYFEIGSYGTDAYLRSDLVPIAIKDANEKTKMNFDKGDVYLIGDTIEDIKCARDSGVKIISVATGIEPIKLLEDHKPDFLFNDFQDINSILQMIEN